MRDELQGDPGSAVAAVSAVRKCADTMERRAEHLTQSLPGVPMDPSLRAKALGLSAALKDTSARVMFELALLQTELSDGQADIAVTVRRLSGLEAAMLSVVADATDLVDQLENAAESDEAQEPAFVLVIEAVGVVMQALERAKAAVGALLSGRGQ